MKVKIKRDIIDWATGDHPDLLVARKGMLGDAVAKVSRDYWPYTVMLEDGHVIGCDLDELEFLP